MSSGKPQSRREAPGGRVQANVHCRHESNALAWTLRRDGHAPKPPSQERLGMSIRPILSLVLALLACSLALVPVAPAAEGDQRTTIFVGSTTYSDGDATSRGTTFGAKWALEFRQDLEWTISGAYTATDGEHEVEGEKYEISSSTTTLQTGLTRLFNNTREAAFVPFVGGGLSVLAYQLEYDYPGGEVGDTSGVGPGVFGHAGVEIRLSRTIHFIPEYVISAHSIETEDGDSFVLVSGGLIVALRIAF
jgi:hypothetical protein